MPDDSPIKADSSQNPASNDAEKRDMDADTEDRRMTERGRITWHCSEEDGGPDVGISVGLGDNAMLWAGECSDRKYEEGGDEVAALGSSGGWWLMIYRTGTESTPLAKFADADAAHAFMDQMAAALLTSAVSMIG